MRILITGGAGFIGSHCVVSLVKNGYTPIIIDNFFNTNKNVIKNLETITKKKIIFYQVDLRDKNKLNLIFKKHKCYSVIHFAGYKAVGESVQKPIYYFENNKKTMMYESVSTQKNIVKVSIVGVGMRSHAGIAGRMFKCLAKNKVNIRMISTSEIKISVVIEQKSLEIAVQALHNEFKLDKK